MDDIYLELKKARVPQDEPVCGMDAYLSGDTVKVASMDDLFNFVRIGTDTLVHKAEKDLWRISEDGNGGMVIVRLFDPNSKQPIKV